MNDDGVFHCCQAAIAAMKTGAAERTWDTAASINIISSIAGQVATSDEAAFINGAELVIDGGSTA